MKKIIKNPETALYPLPAVLVSMGNNQLERNIITISWTGTINSDPPMCYISVRPERHSYQILKRNMEFIINLTDKNLLHAVDWCGIKSGKDTDKFKELNLTPGMAKFVKAPRIEESPVNIECRVKNILELGSHHMFIAAIEAVHVNDNFIDVNGIISSEGLIAYAFKHYYQLGEEIGKFGFSGKKKN